MDAKNAHADSIAASLLAGRHCAIKLRLQDLQPENPSQLADPAQLKDLVKKFKSEGCLRLLARNRIPVLVPRARLQSLIGDNNVSEALHDVSPPLSTPTPLTYLQGQGFHRIEAAKRVLPAADQWWGVDVYIQEDLPETVLRFLREDRDNAKPLRDGFIYRKFLHYKHRGDQYNVKKWLNRLPRSKRKDIKQLNRQRQALPIKQGLHKLLAYSALFDDFMIGTCHRFLPLKCPEEFAHSLKHVLDVWSSIVPVEYAGFLDHVTVTKLEGRCPYYSRRDREFILKASSNDSLFPLMPPAIRTDAVSHALKCRYLIPSIRTFLEDTKWFEPAARALRTLACDPKRTLRRSLKRCWVEPVKATEQRLESMVPLSPRFAAAKFWAAYVQLFSAAYRYFPSLTAFHPRKTEKNSTTTAANCPASAECWWRLARLARALGFSSPEITRILSQIQVRFVANSLLDEARPAPLYTFPTNERHNGVLGLSMILGSAEAVVNATTTAQMTSDVFEKWDVRHKCGRTFDRPFFNDRDYVYLCNLYPEDEENLRPRQVVTSFFVVRNIFHAFFGTSGGSTESADDAASDVSDVSFDSDSEADELLQDPTSSTHAHVENGNSVDGAFEEQGDVIMTESDPHNVEQTGEDSGLSLSANTSAEYAAEQSTEVSTPALGAFTNTNNPFITSIIPFPETPASQYFWDTIDPPQSAVAGPDFTVPQLMQGHSEDPASSQAPSPLHSAEEVDAHPPARVPSSIYSDLTEFPNEEGFGVFPNTEDLALQGETTPTNTSLVGPPLLATNMDTTPESPKRKRVDSAHVLHLRFRSAEQSLESLLAEIVPRRTQHCVVKRASSSHWDVLFFRSVPTGIKAARRLITSSSEERCTFATFDHATGQVKSVILSVALELTLTDQYVLLIMQQSEPFYSSLKVDERPGAGMVRWNESHWDISEGLTSYELMVNDEAESATKRARTSGDSF